MSLIAFVESSNVATELVLLVVALAGVIIVVVVLRSKLR